MKILFSSFLIITALLVMVSLGFSEGLELQLTTNILSGAGKEGDPFQLFVSLSNPMQQELLISFSLGITKPDNETIYYPEMTTNKPSIFLMVPPAFSFLNFELLRLDFGDNVISDYGQYDMTCSLENKITGYLPVSDTASFQYLRDDWFVQSETRNYVLGDMTVGDLNNDNLPDLILSKDKIAKSNIISVVLNKENNSFKNPFNYRIGYRMSPVTLADVNNDGYLDMLVTIILDSEEDYSEILVFLNKGDGSFENFVEYDTGQYSKQVTVADVNNDGYIDMIVSNEKSEDVSVLVNKGDGKFENEARYSVKTGDNSSPTRAAVADVNNDGYIDILVCNWRHDSKESFISVLKNKGDGTFGTNDLYKVGKWPYNSKTGDLNNDGNLDIIVSHSRGIALFFNTGNGTFELSANIECDHFTLADFNNDGFIDILTNDNYMLSIKFNKGDGTFDDKVFEFEHSISQISTSDINNDGYTDIIVSSVYYGMGASIDVNFAFFLNNGDKSFKSPVYYGSGGETVIDDVNNDGLKDIIASSFYTGVSVLLNTGQYN